MGDMTDVRALPDPPVRAGQLALVPPALGSGKKITRSRGSGPSRGCDAPLRRSQSRQVCITDR
jgi:hypothetical protein